MNSSEPSEVVLKGGVANVGNVVRIGDQVARPSYPQTPSVDHFLAYLRDHDAGLSPLPLGADERGRQRLSFIPGVVATPPYPAWAVDEALLIDVAQHQRRLHELARKYQPPHSAVWATSAGDYFPPAAFKGGSLLVCHNDLGISNVVIDPATHRVAGFIDFDYCRPVNRLFDIAVAARHWVPFGDVEVIGGDSLDRVGRFALFCQVHELSNDERATVLALAVAFLEQARANIRALAEAGQVGFQTLLANGYEETNRATIDWLMTNEEALVRVH